MGYILQMGYRREVSQSKGVWFYCTDDNGSGAEMLSAEDSDEVVRGTSREY